MTTVPRLGLAGVTAIAVLCTALGVVVAAAPEGIQPAATCPWLSPSDAAGHRGERLTVCGTAGQQVHRLDDGGQSLGLLDEGGERLRIVVPASGGLLSRLQGKPVCATGTIQQGEAIPTLLIADAERILSFEHLPTIVPELPRLHLAGRIKLPEVISEVRPNLARPGMKAGKVEMECIIETTGSVGPITIVKSLDCENGADQEAVLALMKWRFKPASLDGVPVRLPVSVEIVFPGR